MRTTWIFQKRILRDGGANVPNWNIPDLVHKPLEEILKLDIIYTDMIENNALRKCVTKANIEKSDENPIQILSYFCMLKLITDPVIGKRNRKIVESQFDIKNKDLMKKLHPRTSQRENQQIISGSSLRNAKIVPEIKLENFSDNEENDDGEILIE